MNELFGNSEQLTKPEKITPRMVIREVLGRECADNMIADPMLGFDWAMLAAVSAITARGGPANERERLFMDRVTRD